MAPADFVAARNQLAKQLKAAGQADEAEVVAKLRRPRLAEWALNRLAREEPAVVRRLAGAIRAAQQAQTTAISTGSKGGANGGTTRGATNDLRGATHELRAATSAVIDAAVRYLSTQGSAGGDAGTSGNGESQRDDLLALVRTFVGNADPGPLVAGVVGSEALLPLPDLFPGAPDLDPPTDPAMPASPPAHSTAPAVPTQRTQTTPVTPTAPIGPEKPTAAAKRAMLRAERLGLERNVTAARAAAEAAERAVTAADTALAQAKTELTAARQRVKATQHEAASAAADLAAFDAAHASD